MKALLLPVQADGGRAAGPRQGTGRRPDGGWIGEQSGPKREIAGLGVAERTKRALAQAGLEVTAWPVEIERGALILVATDALIEPGALHALIGQLEPGGAVMARGDDPSGPAAVAVGEEITARMGDLFAQIDQAGQLARLVGQLRERGLLAMVDTGGSRCLRVREQSQAARIERDMLAALVQPTDGWFARHFDRRLSIRLSLPLVRAGVHPNTVTGLATLVGIAGAVLLASASWSMRVLGALAFVGSTVLDGCDGEVARLSLRSSALGRRLDLAGDNLVNAAVFTGIGLVCVRASSGMGTVVAMALAGVAVATVSGFAFSHWLDQTGRSGQASIWYERLSSRDFAYVILLLAVVDRLSWFMWATAIGSFTFALLLGVLRVALPGIEGSLPSLQRGEVKTACNMLPGNVEPLSRPVVEMEVGIASLDGVAAPED